MVDEPIHDDSSYYEISITAGQAFLAVVLLIASLAAAFAFGIVVGQARGRVTPSAKASPPVILEGESSDRGQIQELGVGDETFQPQPAETETIVDEPELIEDGSPEETTSSPSPQPAAPPAEVAQAPEPATDMSPLPHVAQILSTTDRAPAENLAARLIEAGYTSAYVERVPSDAGMLYRVRVRFGSEAEARRAVPNLREYAPGEIWVSKAE